jgi:NAD(P)-dependent dehydrogenase (short-subunit alcohol dehydrogenase family)
MKRGGELAGKVAVVTGAGGTVGTGIVRGFLREGARVLAAEYDEARRGEILPGLDSEERRRCHCVGGDVTVDADVADIVAAAETRFGAIDIMVNNAGGPGALTPLIDTDPADFDATVALLLRSVFLGIRHAGRAMKARGKGGVILNTASIAALAGGYAPAVYSAAKAAVVQLGAQAAVELAPSQIRVNAVSPGMIMGPVFAQSGISAERLADFQPWPEAGRASDIAEAMIFLASDRCRFATGANFVIDGALLAQGPQLLDRLYSAP